MKKIEFLNELEQCLKQFKVEKIDIILRDYEELFIESAQMGKSEQEIIDGLDSPYDIAKRYKGTNKNVKQQKALLKENIRIVKIRFAYYLFAAIIFLSAVIVMGVSMKDMAFIWVGLFSSLLFILPILEYKKIKKYKKMLSDLENLEREDI